MKRILIFVVLLLAQAIPATAQSREKGLDPWINRTLAPYVTQQLLTHPRFKNETVMFVVLKDNVPTPTTNALALSLRDRVLEAAVDTAGISIGWQQGRSGNVAEPSSIDCVNDDVHYFVGIELTQEIDGRYVVSVRALDLEDRTWVSGFGKQWQGKLVTAERQALRQHRVDATFLGAREVPFTESQTDLLAAHLAHQLSCSLQQQLADEYVVEAVGNDTQRGLAGTVELISNNLANRSALTLTAARERTNATLEGKAHQIDGALYQYWLTLTPQSDDSNLAALSASAYIVLPDLPPPSVAQTPRSAPALETASVRLPTVPRATVSIPNAGSDSLIGTLRITEPNNVTECRRPCSMLRTQANADSIVFFLEHQENHGLVRLSAGACRQRTAARIARRGELLSFPISRTATDSRKWNQTHDWSLRPSHDTFYAVVVTDAEVARNMANHIDKLPLRCTNSLRPGVQGDALKTWLDEFAEFAADSSTVLDWRAIEVRNVM